MPYFILKNKHPVEVDAETADRWMREGHQSLRMTHVGERYVSTAFLVIDHNWGHSDRPVHFETMIFPELEYCVRDCTYDEAMDSHIEAVLFLQRGGNYGEEERKKGKEESEK